MIKKIDNRNMGKSKLSWLESNFHFSFSDYYNPDNIRFGSLRVINDDIIAPHTGFDTHPHSDMEIVTYVVDGMLTHRDSMGNEHTLSRGEVQYMSAGTGITHSEHNLSDYDLRTLQIWIYPDQKGHTPNYGEEKFTLSDRKNKWLNIVSGKSGDAKIKINQDFNIYVIELDAGIKTTLNIDDNRQAYIVQIEGSSSYNDITLNERDAIEVIEKTLNIKAITKSHIIVFEMNKE